ncbi:MAG TPA: hypothetical protein DCP28_23355, partial [Cytophagales bacterium]|nr:hypothetical protein [Cytophagales bacterium]
VEVITDDQASVYGFFLGAYEEGIAVLKDQPHPFVTAEKMEVVLVPQDQVRKVTLRTLHNRTYRPLAARLAISALGSPFVAEIGEIDLAWASSISAAIFGIPTLIVGTAARIMYPSNRVFTVGPGGRLSYSQLMQKLSPYQQVPELSLAFGLPDYAIMDPGDPETYKRLNPAMPMVARHFSPTRWSFDVLFQQPYHLGFSRLQPSLIENTGVATEEYTAGFTQHLNATISYALYPRLRVGLNYQYTHQNWHMDYSFFTPPENSGRLEWNYHYVMALLQYPLLAADMMQKKRHGLHLGWGVGALIGDVQYNARVGLEDPVYARSFNQWIRPATHLMVSYEYLLTRNLGAQVRFGGNVASSYRLTNVFPFTTASAPEIRVPMGSLYWAVGASFKL